MNSIESIDVGRQDESEIRIIIRINGEISNDSSLTIKNVKIKNFQFKQKCSSFEGLEPKKEKRKVLNANAI